VFGSDYEAEARHLEELLQKIERAKLGMFVLDVHDLEEIRRALADELERCRFVSIR
jgi:hypothetical protein